MADIVLPEKRSRMMSGIRGKNTKPEILVRKGLHSRGYRYSLHRKDLPRKPDIVLPKYGAVILVQGCFWHGHDCHLFKWPQSRQDFWKEKISGNRNRDTIIWEELSQRGWRVLEIYECALKGKSKMSPEKLLDQTCFWLKGQEKKGLIKGKS